MIIYQVWVHYGAQALEPSHSELIDEFSSEKAAMNYCERKNRYTTIFNYYVEPISRGVIDEIK